MLFFVLSLLIVATGAQTPKLTLTIHNYESSPPSDGMVQLEIKWSFAYFGLGDDQPAIRFKLQKQNDTLEASKLCNASFTPSLCVTNFYGVVNGLYTLTAENENGLLPEIGNIVSTLVPITTDMSSSTPPNSGPIQNSSEPSSHDTPTPSPHTNLETQAIIGGAIGGVVVIALCAIAFIYLRRRPYSNSRDMVMFNKHKMDKEVAEVESEVDIRDHLFYSWVETQRGFFGGKTTDPDRKVRIVE
ncbi:hypothetical protein VNI00_006726 [Paramarasmius palmivorus]|uniref:Uncharacterized protein n=1 Tax=Paramarasmius palmivorus TaxID=297713 RepID=A0AAW0D9N5_9AGAR